MKFKTKISGTSVTDFDIEPLFNSQFVWLSEIMEKVHTQKAMDYIFETFRFTKGYEEKANDWVAIFDYDSIYKITILENYPGYEEELLGYFGENWLNQYIRFNH